MVVECMPTRSLWQLRGEGKQIGKGGEGTQVRKGGEGKDVGEEGRRMACHAPPWMDAC